MHTIEVTVARLLGRSERSVGSTIVALKHAGAKSVRVTLARSDVAHLG